MSKILVIGIDERKVDDGILRTLNYFPVTDDGVVKEEKKSLFTGIDLSHIKAGDTCKVYLEKAKTSGNDKLVGILKA